jgi:hypothetical protein
MAPSKVATRRRRMADPTWDISIQGASGLAMDDTCAKIIQLEFPTIVPPELFVDHLVLSFPHPFSITGLG